MMTRYSLLLLFLIISCQKNWSSIEVNNFLERCQNSNLTNSNKEDHSDFCECILNQAMTLDLPYSEFLKRDLTQNEKDLILYCIEMMMSKSDIYDLFIPEVYLNKKILKQAFLVPP